MNKKKLSYLWDNIWFGLLLWLSDVTLMIHSRAISEIIANSYGRRAPVILGIAIWFLFFSGLLVMIGGFLKPYPEETHENNNSQSSGARANPPSREHLIKEYELAQEMHNYYGRIVWQIGAILLGGGTTAFGLVVTETSNRLPKSTPLLFWLILLVMIIGFLSLLRRYRGISYAHIGRCKEIEKELGFRQHTYVEEAGRRTILIGGKPHTVPTPGGWRILQSFCILLAILTFAVSIVASSS